MAVSGAGKKKPRFRGAHGRLLVCGGVLSALLVVRCGLCRAACSRKEQVLCQRNLTSASRSNRPSGPSGEGKFDFGQYVTSAAGPLLSTSSTRRLGRCAT